MTNPNWKGGASEADGLSEAKGGNVGTMLMPLLPTKDILLEQ